MIKTLSLNWGVQRQVIRVEKRLAPVCFLFEQFWLRKSSLAIDKTPMAIKVTLLVQKISRPNEL